MTLFGNLYEFTDAGMTAFEQVFNGMLEEGALDVMDPALARAIPGTAAFEPGVWCNSKEMAQAIIDSCGAVSVGELLNRNGLWAWLSFVMRDEVYPRRPDGRRKLGEIYRWWPADTNDYRKAQRHLVRTPVLLLFSFGRNADHLLCGKPSVPGEVREQLTSQQDMFHPTIQSVARALYFDDDANALRRGVGGKGGGSARRFTQVRKQLDVTWDLYSVSPEQLTSMLPREFDKFMRSDASAGGE